jgi:polyhydroxyalkanoate synthesis regulator phasin
MVNANIPNRMNLCKKMLALGANPHSKSKHGVSPYSFAQTTGDTELLEIFDQVSTQTAVDLSYIPPTTSNVLQQLPATYNWKTVYQELWDELVPPSGPANSLQGELLRSIGKLSDEFFRNGNMNWDHHKEFYLDLINLLKTHLLDGSITMDEKELKDALKKLTHFHIVYYPKTESPHDIIAEAVVQWCAAHTTFIPYKA